MGWRQDVLTEIDQLKNAQATKLNELNAKKEWVANKKQDLTSGSGEHYPSVPAVKDGLDTLEISVNSYTDTQLNDYIPLSQKGVAGGVAELDAQGTVPAAQLPSYVDDVVEGTATGIQANGNATGFEDSNNVPITGETGKIYIDTTSGKNYRWSGTVFAVISSSLALGETSSTAYRGDRGKIAYDHSQITNGNPHGVTKADVGLPDVQNYSPADMPLSTASASADQVNADALLAYKQATGVPDWSAQFLAALNF